jgi:hypothetical protein
VGSTSIYNWLCLFGIPTLVIALGKYLHSVIKRIHEDNNAIKLGVQAVLRAEMIDYYNEWRHSPTGVPLHVREAYENCWVQYEALGANGVMSDIHNEFMSLPLGELK